MPKVHTHYDNLKVARDAPPEVIRAAYKSLSQKYHPDRNPSDSNAGRVMAIINASYDVLSDPVKRREHDEWILKAESEAHIKAAPRPQAPASPPQSPAARTGPRSRRRLTAKPLFVVSHFRCYWPAYGFLILSVVLLFALGAFEGSSPSKSRSSSPGPPVVTPTEVAAAPRPPSAPASPVVRPSYVRPPLAPNGEPWPAATGYVSGYKRLHTNGLSSVTVDNSQNDSDVFVKLVYRGEQQPVAVRVFFIRAREQFRLANVRAGVYDIRYKDLDAGVISKSEAFDLKEIEVADGVQYSKMHLTLYKVRDGNMRIETISEEEF